MILKITSNANTAALLTYIDTTLHDAYTCTEGAATKCSYYELANK